MSGRALFAVVAGTGLLIAFIVVVVVPGVRRGGWLEVVGVIAVIAAIAIFDRAFRRISRGR